MWSDGAPAPIGTAHNNNKLKPGITTWGGRGIASLVPDNVRATLTKYLVPIIRDEVDPSAVLVWKINSVIAGN